jgi:hypothetical protein
MVRTWAERMEFDRMLSRYVALWREQRDLSRRSRFLAALSLAFDAAAIIIVFMEIT